MSWPQPPDLNQPPRRHDASDGKAPPPYTVPPIGYTWEFGREGFVRQRRLTWWDRRTNNQRIILALTVYTIGCWLMAAIVTVAILRSLK